MFSTLSSWTTLVLIVLVYGGVILRTGKCEIQDLSIPKTFYSIILFVAAASLPILDVLSQMQHPFSAVNIIFDIADVLWALSVSVLYAELRPFWSF